MKFDSTATLARYCVAMIALMSVVSGVVLALFSRHHAGQAVEHSRSDKTIQSASKRSTSRCANHAQMTAFFTLREALPWTGIPVSHGSTGFPA
jgi:hypothetical protein